MRTALILFAHGARDPEWARPMQRVREAILAAQPAVRVELAFLEFMSPGLAESVDALAAEAYERVIILPMFIAQGGHLKRELPEMVAALRQKHSSLELVLMGAVGEQEPVVQAMASAALALAGL